MSYVNRPNRPQGLDYCPALPACPPPKAAGLETLAALLARYNKNRGDWEIDKLGARQWVSARLSTAAPGAQRGDLYLPPGASAGLQAAIWAQGVPVWTSALGSTTFSLAPPPNAPAAAAATTSATAAPAATASAPTPAAAAATTTSAGAAALTTSASTYTTAYHSDECTDDEEEAEAGNMCGM